MTDEMILQGLRKGDPSSIKWMYARFFPMIVDLVRSKGGRGQQDAEDTYMNTLEVLLHKVNEEHFVLSSALSTFFYSIARRQWLKQLYKLKPTSRVTLALESELIGEPDLTLAFEKKERYDLYREKFAQLSEGCQQILQLWLNKVSMQDIAAQLQFASENYARQRKFKCKKKLTELIQADERYQELRL